MGRKASHETLIVLLNKLSDEVRSLRKEIQQRDAIIKEKDTKILKKISKIVELESKYNAPFLLWLKMKEQIASEQEQNTHENKRKIGLHRGTRK